MSRDHIRVIDDYRHCHENEFFFTYDPRKTSGTKQKLCPEYFLGEVLIGWDAYRQR